MKWLQLLRLFGLSLCLLLSASGLARAQAVIGGDGFKAALEIVLGRMLQSYQDAQPEPLHIAVIDIDSPLGRNIFSAQSRHSGDASLSISFHPKLMVNGSTTPSCLVRYKPTRRDDQLWGYESLGVFTRRDILYYLAAHEFGHCMAFHQTSLGRAAGLSAPESELLADKVAMTFFIANHQPQVAAYIIEINEHATNPAHRNAKELARFFNAMSAQAKIEPTLGVKNMHDVYRIAIDPKWMTTD